MKKNFKVVKNFKIVKRSCSLNRYYRVICILLPRATQRRPYFSKTIFSSLPWGMSHMLPGFSRKKFILLSKFDQKSKI